MPEYQAIKSDISSISDKLDISPIVSPAPK